MSGYRVLGMENAPTTRSNYYADDPYFVPRDCRTRYNAQASTTPRRSLRRQQRDDYRVSSPLTPSNRYSVRDNHAYQSTRTLRDEYYGYAYTTPTNHHTTEEYDDEEYEDSGMTHSAPSNRSFRNPLYVQNRDPDWIPPPLLQGRRDRVHGIGGERRDVRPTSDIQQGYNTHRRQLHRDDSYAPRECFAQSAPQLARARRRNDRVEEQQPRYPSYEVQDPIHAYLPEKDPFVALTEKEQLIIALEQKIAACEARQRARELNAQLALTQPPPSQERYDPLPCPSIIANVRVLSSGSHTYTKDDVAPLAMPTTTASLVTATPVPSQSGGQVQPQRDSSQQKPVHITTVDASYASSRADIPRESLVGLQGATVDDDAPRTGVVNDQQVVHTQFNQSIHSSEQLQSQQGYVSNLSPFLVTKVCVPVSGFTANNQGQDATIAMSTPMASPTIAPKVPVQGSDSTHGNNCITCGGRDHFNMDCQTKQQEDTAIYDCIVAVEEVSQNEATPIETSAVAFKEEKNVAATHDGNPMSFATRCLNPVKEVDLVHQRLPPSPPRCLDKPDSYRVNFNDTSYFEVRIGTMIIPIKQPTQLHQNPCDQQEVSPISGNTVSLQCTIPFPFGQYKTNFLSSLVAMDVNNLFLGRPWQSIHRVLLDAYINTSVFTYLGKHVDSLPLPCYEDSQDQVTRTIVQEINAYDTALEPEGPTFDPGDPPLRQQVDSTNSAHTVLTRCNMPANTALQEHCHQKELHQPYGDDFNQQALLDLNHLQELLAHEENKCDAAARPAGTTMRCNTRTILNDKDDEFIEQRVHICVPRCKDTTASLSFFHNGGRCCYIFTEKAINHLSLSTRPPPQHNGLQRIDSTGNIVSRQCLFPFSFESSLDSISFHEMTLGAITIWLGRPLPSSHVLHVVYLNTIVFTYHVKHVIVLLPYFRERLQTQVEHFHHKAILSAKAAFISSRPPSEHYSASQFSALKFDTRCQNNARSVLQSTTLLIRGDNKVAFNAHVPQNTPRQAIQGLYDESLEVVRQLNRPKPPDPQQYDQPRMYSNTGNTVQWQCLFTFSFGHIHEIFFSAVIGMDAIPLLLGRPWQSTRRVLPEGYLDTAVFTYHRERVTFSSLSIPVSLQEQVEHERDKNGEIPTTASSSTRQCSKHRDASNTTRRSRRKRSSSQRQDDAYKDDSPKANTTGKYNGSTVPTPSMLRAHINKLTGPPLCRLTQLTWVPGAILQHRQCSRFVFDTGDLAWEYFKGIQDSDNHLELPREHGVQVPYQVASLHKYEELKFNKGEAGTLHSQVGEGDAILPSRKTAFFLACLASRIEPMNFNGFLSSGSEIAISSNYLHSSKEIAFFIRVLVTSIERVPRVPPSTSSPMSSDAFFPRDPLDDRMIAFYLNQRRSSALKSINDEIFGIECTIHFELDHDLVIKCILILAFIS